MRNQKHVENPAADLITELVQQLSPERRRELVEAAACSRFHDLLQVHQKSTLKAFIKALQADIHWGVLEHLVLGDVITTEGGEDADASTKRASVTAETAPSVDKRQMQLSIVGETGVAPAGVSPDEPAAFTGAGAIALTKTKPKHRKKGDVLDDIMALLESTPGLRSEQIQKHLEVPAVLLKPALAALRKQNRVRMQGVKRAAQYFVVAEKPSAK
jgi:hypothetical protein